MEWDREIDEPYLGQIIAVTSEPLIDPQARVRTLCHAVLGQWMTEGIGFYCGIAMRWFRDAFCELEVLLGVDGGLTRANVARVAAIGADVGMSGSAIFDGGDVVSHAAYMLEQVRSASRAAKPSATAATASSSLS